MAFLFKSKDTGDDTAKENSTRCGKNTGNKKVPEKGTEKPTAASKKTKLIRSTQSVLPFLEVRDGVIVTKDQRFFKLIEFSPINFELKPADEQESIIAQLSATIRTWPENVHMKIISTESDISPFIKDLEMRRKTELSAGNESCANLLIDQIAMLQEISQTKGTTHRFFIIFEYLEQGGFKRRPPFSEIAMSLAREARSIAASLYGCGNLLVSSNSREYILEALYAMICKEQYRFVPFAERQNVILNRYREQFGHMIQVEDIPVNDLCAPDYIDSYLSPRYIMVDGLYLTYCFVPSSGYPNQIHGGWLQELFGYMDGVDVDFWVKKIPADSVTPRLRYKIKTNRITVNERDSTDKDFDDLQAAVESGYYIKQSLAEGDEFCYIATVLTISAPDLDTLQARFNAMRSHCIRRDMDLRCCVFQQDEAFLSCLPLTELYPPLFKKAKRNIMASQLGSCYPFTAYALEDAGGVFMGLNANNNSAVFLNPFDTTKYQSANMIILGPSGSGKTYTLLSMLLRMRQKGLQIYMIAPLKGHEMLRMCTALGGEFIRIAPGSEQNINIMDIQKEDRGDSAALDNGGSNGSLLASKIQEMHTFFSILLKDRTDQEVQLIDEALKTCYGHFGITESNQSLLIPGTNDYKTMPTLQDLYDVLREMEGCDRIAQVLARYVTGSARSFSQPTNVNLDNKLVVIDVSELTAEMLPIGMFVATSHIFSRVKMDRTTRKVIALDETWRLMRASKQTAEFCLRCYKEMRGYGAATISATQDLADMVTDETGAALINNARFKILLPMEKKEVEACAGVIDLTKIEMNRLKQTSLRKGDGGRRNALLIANNNHVFITVTASKTEHDLITTNAEDLKRIVKDRTYEE